MSVTEVSKAAEQAAARNPQSVREMFARITPRYDFLNHLLSLHIDRWWRRRVARRFEHILKRPDAKVLDLCCGTGDLSAALAARAHSTVRVVGADFCRPMLERARTKLDAPGRAALLAEADALVLPFADASFDLVTAAFGFRNLADYHAGLREIRRVLRPGGEVGILECSEPVWPLRPLYDFYFRRLMPRIGGAISGDANAYYYLTHTVANFPEPPELAAWMRDAGLADARFERFTAGIACLHIGRRP